jgi:TonB-dependent receptor
VGGQFNARRDFATRHPTYVKAGVRFREQTRDLNRAQRVFTYLGPDGRTGVNPANGIDDGSLLRFLDGSYTYRFFEGRYPVAQYPSVPAVREAQRNNPAWFSENAYTTFASPMQNARNVTERVSAGYVSGNIDIKKLSLLAGVRVEDTHLEGEGARRANRLAPAAPNETREQARARAETDWGRRERATGGYRNTFPSVHLRYQLLRELLARASWTTSIGRPNYGEIIPNTTVDEVNQTVRVTNPGVKPQHSTNFDVTLEYYIKPAGLLSVGWFRKEIRDFITRRTSLVEAGSNNGFDGQFAGYEVSRSSNTGAALITGYEFNFQQQFTFLPGLWKSFGAFANYTYLKAEGSQGDDGRGGRNELGGFVPRAGNLGLSYQGPRLTVRLQANHRGATFQAPAAVAINTVARSAYTTVNLSLQYKVNARWGLYADWINLTDETENQHLAFAPSRVRTVFASGPEITAGVSARF